MSTQLPGEPPTPEGDRGPADSGPTDTGPQAATGPDDPGGTSDELGEVSGGSEIAETGPSA